MPIMSLPLRKLRHDVFLNRRYRKSADAIEEYARAISAGERLQPIIAVKGECSYFIVDGLHRYLAAVVSGLNAFEVDAREGTYRDAALLSRGMDADRRSAADERFVVLSMLEDLQPACWKDKKHICSPEDRCWSLWSDDEIAKACKVTSAFVASVRAVLNEIINDRPHDYFIKHGSLAKMKPLKKDRPYEGVWLHDRLLAYRLASGT